MRIEATTSFNDAIRKMSDGHSGAGSVLALVHKERPQNVMSYIRALDSRGTYGRDIYQLFWSKCGGSLESFLKDIGSPDEES